MTAVTRVDIQSLRRKGVAAARRFPLAFTCAAIATAALLVRVEAHGSPIARRATWHFFLAALFGFPLFIGLKTLAERKAWEAPATNAARAAAVLLVAACSFAVPFDSIGSLREDRLCMLFFGFCSLMSLAPYPGRGEINGFWHYNKALLARLLFAFLITQLLIAGIGSALAGIDYLAGSGASEFLCVRLWAIISVFIGSIIFLRGIPLRPERLQTAVEYPRWLGVVTRNVLIPLIGLYLLILYIYAGKIIAQASWPKGGVAGYVLGAVGHGILTYMLVYPVREKAESRVVPVFMRWIFPLMLPLALLLFLSVWRRIADYGVTESRYFGVLAAGWLAATCVYFIAGKAKNIKAVPASIALLAFLSSFGPWGAGSVSAWSQAARLEKILVKNGILSAGGIRPAAEPVPAQDEGEISRIVHYLSERDEMDRIARWFGDVAQARSEQDAMARMGLSYDPNRRGKEIHFLARDARSMKIAGYDYSVTLSALLASGNDTWESPVDQPAGNKRGRYRLFLNGKDGKLFLTDGQDTVLAADIVPLVRKLRAEFKDDGKASPIRVPREKLEIAERRGYIGIKVCLSEIAGTEREGTVRIGNVQGEVLVKTEP